MKAQVLSKSPVLKPSVSGESTSLVHPKRTRDSRVERVDDLERSKPKRKYLKRKKATSRPEDSMPVQEQH